MKPDPAPEVPVGSLDPVGQLADWQHVAPLDPAELAPSVADAKTVTHDFPSSSFSRQSEQRQSSVLGTRNIL